MYSKRKNKKTDHSSALNIIETDHFNVINSSRTKPEHGETCFWRGLAQAC